MDIEVKNQGVDADPAKDQSYPKRASLLDNWSRDNESSNDKEDVGSERRPGESQVIFTVDENLKIQQSVHQSQVSAD